MGALPNSFFFEVLTWKDRCIALFIFRPIDGYKFTKITGILSQQNIHKMQTGKGFQRFGETSKSGVKRSRFRPFSLRDFE